MVVLPGKLSGGKRQRVAIARALANVSGGVAGGRANGQPGRGDERRRVRGTAADGETEGLAARMNWQVTLQGGRVAKLHAKVLDGRETEANYAGRFV